ncbi:MAG: DNA polymerase III subunit beta [Pseudomonadales bacterium]
MKFQLSREVLLGPLQNIIGVVERRQTMPILSNVMLSIDGDTMLLTGTDLEVELQSSTVIVGADPGDITVPGRKLLDICKALPEEAMLEISLDKGRIKIKSGRSRFTLSTLPATEFPTIEDINTTVSFKVPQKALKHLIYRTHFSMAQQDVRFYLNGSLLEIDSGRLRSVATDGHRLALCDAKLSSKINKAEQVIVPRKGILELLRLLAEVDDTCSVALGSNHIRVSMGDITFTSKLIDGRFPDYERVIPSAPEKQLKASREVLRHALVRAAILSNEKYRGVRLSLDENILKIQAHNPEQEEAEEEIEVEYSGEPLEVGFNVVYLMDALGALESEIVSISLSDPNSSCLIQDPDNEDCRYVVMPMRL